MEIKDRLDYTSEVMATAMVPIPSSLDRSSSVLKVERITKRIIDILCSICGIVALIPLTIGIYIANLISGDKGPVFYSQNRIGQNGKIFKMYKYRSMIVGSEKKLEEHLEENEAAREEYKTYKKLKYDPRITKIGNFIRKTSIDEFPQFINVLKGEMSLVGPRPYLPKEKEDINGFFGCITSCKPGITGLWQISGRSNVTFVDRLDMDMKYYYKQSLKFDYKIFKGTLRNISKKEGAR